MAITEDIKLRKKRKTPTGADYTRFFTGPRADLPTKGTLMTGESGVLGARVIDVKINQRLPNGQDGHVVTYRGFDGWE